MKQLLRKAGFPFSILPYILISIFASTVFSADWYHANWNYRQRINIASSLTDADLMNFPLLVKIKDQYHPLFSSAQTGGDDILFTLSDGVTRLDHEIEYYSNSGIKELVAWIRIPSLSLSTDTAVYMYYGNNSASDQQNPQTVWDGSYVMVQHLNETSGEHNDSTGYGNNSNGVLVLDQSAPGKIGYADSFEGISSNHYIRIPDSTSLDITGAITIEAWVNPGADQGHKEGIVNKKSGATGYRLEVNRNGDCSYTPAELLTMYGDSGIQCSNGAAIIEGVWKHISFVYDPVSDPPNPAIRFYVNGEPAGQEIIALTNDVNGNDLIIGSFSESTATFNGSIDEVRISNTARGADWLRASYNNQDTPDNYLDFGTIEGPPCEGCVYFDDFNDGDDNSWSNVSGKWEIVNEGECITCQYSEISSSGSEPALSLTDSVSGDRTIEVKAMDEGSGALQNAFIVFAYDEVTGDAYWSGASIDEGLWVIEKIGPDGTRSSFDSQPDSTLSSGAWYDLKVVITGDTVTLYEDDVVKANHTFTGAVPTGKVGIGGLNNRARFDDFSVTCQSGGNCDFSDYFSAGNDDSWSRVSGIWAVAEGCDKDCDRDYITISGYGRSFSLTDYTISDMTIETEAISEDSSGSENFFIVFGFNDSDPDNRKVYWAGARINQGKWVIEEFDLDADGNITNFTSLKDQSDSIYTRWYKMKVVMNGDTVTLYVDGKEKINYTFPGGMQAGKVGVAGNNSRARFDNFRVTQCLNGDTDCDGIADGYDNCPDKSNVNQADQDSDGVGDVCEENVITVKYGTVSGQVNRNVFGNSVPANENGFNLENDGGGIWNPDNQDSVPEVIDLANDIELNVIRFPGGNVDDYNWENAIDINGPRDNFLFGIDEFMQMAVEVGAEPVIVISYFTGEAQDAANLVEYLNSPDDGTNPNGGTDWAAKRTANGHPMPYNVKYFEIGNEVFRNNYDPDDYSAGYLAFYYAMKTVDPSIKIGVVLNNALNEHYWNRVVMESVGAQTDFGILHNYPTAYTISSFLMERLNPLDMFGVALGKIDLIHEVTYRKVLAILKDNSGLNIPLAITEHNSGFSLDVPVKYRFSMGSALVNSDLLSMFMKPVNNVLFANHHTFITSSWGTLKPEFDYTDPGYTGAKTYLERPNYHLFKLYHDHFGDLMISTDVESGMSDFIENNAYKKRVIQEIEKGSVLGKNVLGDNWVITDFPGAVVQQEGGVLEIEFQNPTEHCGYWQSQKTAVVKPDTYYRLSGFIKTDSLIDWDRGVSIMVAGGDGSAIDTDRIKGTYDWQYESILYKTPPDITSVTVMARKLGDDCTQSPGYPDKTVEGTAYFKDVKLEEFEPDTKLHYLTVNASKSADGTTVYLVVTNRNMVDALSTNIVLNDFTPSLNAGAWILKGPSVDATNESINDNVNIAAQPFQIYNTTFEYIFEPASVTVLEIGVSGNIAPIPDAGGYYETNEGEEIVLDGSGSYDSDGSIVLYEWSIDINTDGTYDYNYSSSSPTHSYIFTQQGENNIRLRVTDDLGATGETFATAAISDTSPTADFEGSPASGELPLTVCFTNSSTGYDQPLSHEWNFGEIAGVDSTEVAPCHIYPSPGTYAVGLTVVDSDGSTNTLTKTDYVTVTLPIHSLAITKTGNGTGTVTSLPAGINCGAECTTMYEDGALVSLTYLPDAGSTFSGWQGGGCGGSGDCTLSMNDDTDIEAAFSECPNLPVKIVGGAHKQDLQSICTDVVDGGTVQTQAARYSEDLTVNCPKSIIVEGGYTCDYSAITGKTILNGNVTISDGKVTIENFVIE